MSDLWFLHDLCILVMQIPAHHADRVLQPELLELLAGRPLIAGQVMNGADCSGAAALRLDEQMRAPLSGWLEDHCLLSLWIDPAVCQDG